MGSYTNPISLIPASTSSIFSNPLSTGVMGASTTAAPATSGGFLIPAGFGGAAAAQQYIGAVNQAGTVNQNKIKANGMGTNGAIMNIVLQYAREFWMGNRGGTGAQYANVAIPNTTGGQFSLIASMVKNQGGNYNNGVLKKLILNAANQIKTTNPAASAQLTQLANQPGVGAKDVQTLGAFAKALDVAGSPLTLSQVYDPNTGTSPSGAINKNSIGKLQKAIAYENSPQFQQDLANFQAGNFGAISNGARGAAAGKAATPTAGTAQGATATADSSNAAPAAQSATAQQYLQQLQMLEQYIMQALASMASQTAPVQQPGATGQGIFSPPPVSTTATPATADPTKDNVLKNLVAQITALKQSGKISGTNADSILKLLSSELQGNSTGQSVSIPSSVQSLVANGGSSVRGTSTASVSPNVVPSLLGVGVPSLTTGGTVSASDQAVLNSLGVGNINPNNILGR